jgi:hypothetical protein
VRQFFTFDHRWFALCAVFSLFSLFVFVNGEWVWLMYLMFLLFLTYLIPVRSGRTGAAPAVGGCR